MEADVGSAITVVKAALSTTEATRILEEFNNYSCISIPPVRPKGGQVFLYQADSVDKQGLCSLLLALVYLYHY